MPDAPPPNTEPGGALHGLRVLEWASTLPAAYAGKILADLGAEVLLVEPPSGSPLRGAAPLVSDPPDPLRSGRFLYLAAGKQSVVTEQRAGTDTRIVTLARTADVVITDEHAPVGLLAGLPPSAVSCAITPFGSSGPYAGFRGNHLTVFHSGGEGHLLPTGRGFELFPERPPVQVGSDMADYDAGANAAVAILAALIRRHDRGIGETIDVSGQESQLTLNRTRLSRFHHDGVEMRRGPSPYAAGGMIGCADGFVQLVGLSPDHCARLGSVAGGEALAEALRSAGSETAAVGALLRDWCGDRPRAEVVRVLADAGAAVGPYADARDLLESAQLEARGFLQDVEVPGRGTVRLPGAPYRLSATPARLGPAPSIGTAQAFASDPAFGEPAAFAGGDAPPPLDGVRVLDFTWAAAGPYATLLLAFLGAEVIKVETSLRPDAARRGFLADYGGINRSPNFDELNLNKRSLQVDLTDARGLEVVKRLAAISDVVVNNFRPGVMERYGMGAEALLAAHPSLIVAASSANGSTGPEAAGAGFASIFGASGGLGEQTGYRDGPATEVGESTDYRSANALAVAILAALFHRRRTGEGQIIDLSSREVVIATAPDALLARVLGVPWDPRIGNDHRMLSPHGVFPTAGEDEWLAICAADDGEWARLCGVLGQKAWPEEHPTARERMAGRERIDAAIGEWSHGRALLDAFATLQAAGVTAAPSFTNRDLASDPHLEARAVFVPVEHPEIGRHLVMRAPWCLARTRCDIRRHGPLLGQDNEYVLETILGIPRDAYQEWEGAFR